MNDNKNELSRISEWSGIRDMFSMKKLSFVPLLCLFLFACQSPSSEVQYEALLATEIPGLSTHGGAPNLWVSPEEEVYLSWVEYLDDTTDALQFSILEKDQWTKPKRIAQGNDWFVNWADFPSMVAFPNNKNQLAAHWLQKSANGTYDYDVHIATSQDQGESWSTNFIPHTDGIAAEHGFVSMIALPSNRILALWLDGRNTKTEASAAESDHGHGHGGGAMTLRAAEFDVNGQLYAEAEIDARVCDCCQTDLVWTPKGAVAVYRDRSKHEYRDIAIARRLNGQWEEPRIIFRDQWKTTACPVNGPAIAVQDSLLAVAWYSAAAGKNEVKVIFSHDFGANFGLPTKVDLGQALGRVDIEIMPNGLIYVTWMEGRGEAAEIRLAQINSHGEVLSNQSLSSVSAARKTGFPILTARNNQLILAWTQADSSSMIRTVQIDL